MLLSHCRENYPINSRLFTVLPVSVARKRTRALAHAMNWLFATFLSQEEKLNWILAGNLRKQMDLSYIWQQTKHLLLALESRRCQLLFDNLNLPPWFCKPGSCLIACCDDASLQAGCYLRFLRPSCGWTGLPPPSTRCWEKLSALRPPSPNPLQGLERTGASRVNRNSLNETLFFSTISLFFFWEIFRESEVEVPFWNWFILISRRFRGNISCSRCDGIIQCDWRQRVLSGG